MTGGRFRAVVVALLAAVLALTGCSAGPSLGDAGIVVGTAAPVTSLDPAGAAGAGGELVAEQVYPHLLAVPPGGSAPQPDIAAAAGFDASGAYVVTLKPDLRFANGHPLDARDVVASIARQRTLRPRGGPWPLLGGIASVTARDLRTVVFTLASPGDQRFPAVLASPAGAIVDRRVFSSHALARAQEVVAGQPFAGPYTLQSDNPGDLLTFHANPHYRGLLGSPRSPDITLKLYADAGRLAGDAMSGAIDLAYGGLGMRQLRTLHADRRVRVAAEPGGAMHWLVFDPATMPYGTAHDDADPAKALAVRTACADLVDRAALAAAGAGATAPVWGFVPAHLPGESIVLRRTTGDGHGAPDVDAARRVLDGARVETPVPLSIAVPDDASAASAAESAALASQLGSSGLVSVELHTVPAAQFAVRRGAGVYPAYVGGWDPDGRDPAAYRAPFLAADTLLASPRGDAAAAALVATIDADADPVTRGADLAALQARLAAVLPVLPLQQDEQLAATANGVTGIRFDGSYTLRFGSLRMP